jgi:hypothetical protein
VQKTVLKLAVALFAVAGALVGSSLAALSQRSNATAWSQRALVAEQELVQKRAEVAALEEGLAAATTEGSELTERIDELANEKAQTVDDKTASEVQRDAFKRVAQGYAAVAAKWKSCVAGHEKYEDVLSNPGQYDATDVKRFLSDLEAVCSEAEREEQSLQSQLAQ